MKSILVLLLFALGIFRGEPAHASDPFTLTVMPSKSHQEGKFITMADEKADEFYVVLNNVSKETQAIFESGNRWGDQNISLELTLEDGRKTVLSRRVAGFTGNVPSTFLIPAGAPQVFALRLDRNWEAKPVDLPSGEQTQVSVKAIYEVKETAEGTKNKVWTGRVESKPYQFILRRWR